MQEVISLEKATEEANNWVAKRRYRPKKLATLEDSIETLIDGIRYGYITVLEDDKLKYPLSFPIKNEEGGVAISEFIFKQRVTKEEVEPKLKSVPTGDAFGIIDAYLLAAIEQPKGILKNLDTSTDLSTARSLALFFL